jgi:hypothetical protein
LVVLLRPSAWPRGVGPGCLSTSSTLMSELRNQLASASLEKQKYQQSAKNTVIHQYNIPSWSGPDDEDVYSSGGSHCQIYRPSGGGLDIGCSAFQCRPTF